MPVERGFIDIECDSELTCDHDDIVTLRFTTIGNIAVVEFRLTMEEALELYNRLGDLK